MEQFGLAQVLSSLVHLEWMAGEMLETSQTDTFPTSRAACSIPLVLVTKKGCNVLFCPSFIATKTAAVAIQSAMNRTEPN